jgi:antitoxin component YwqK of YwqJK toxin-antitoxin module
MVQLTDRNGLSETISSEERLQNLHQLNFETTQPYQKVLRVYKTNTGQNKSILISYHPNGQMHQYLEILNARAFGKYYEWFSNGQKHIEANVIGGEADLGFTAQKDWLFDNTSYVWDETGHLISQIPYNKGILEGDYIEYFSNRDIKKITSYHQNQICQDVIEYRSKNQLLKKIRYDNGKKMGTSFEYWPSNQIRSQEEYQDDLLLEATYFDENQKILSSIHQGNGKKAFFQDDYLFEYQEYSHGLPEGKVERFSKTQELISSYNVKNGKKENEEEIYYLKDELPLGQKTHVKLMITWHEGVINGMIKTWYLNGNLESQRQMLQNKKHGPSCAWYQDGSIMLIEEYEQDLLTKGFYYKMGEKEPLSQIDHGNGIATLFDGKGIFLRKILYEKGKPQE